MRWLTGEEWGEVFGRFQRDAFHLELKDSYAVAGEATRYTAWLAGKEETYEEAAAWFRDWTDKVREATASGRTIRRLRVVSEPISDYIRFEWKDTVHNVEAGEDVRWLPRQQVPAGSLFPRDGDDFWLLDDTTAVFNHFHSNGRSRGKELVTEPSVVRQCVQVRDALWSLAIPHGEYKPNLA